ncbi:MAG: carboxypeptidase regulatory-like domain-containing protein [Planctomycetes bacterium]|nr:carboxypeptidase regulatory-like domain-containing protein [Planctomycetota bacterium]
MAEALDGRAARPETEAAAEPVREGADSRATIVRGGARHPAAAGRVRGSATLWCSYAGAAGWGIAGRASLAPDGAWSVAAPEEALAAHVALVTADGWLGSVDVPMLWPGQTLDAGAVLLARGDVGEGRVLDAEGRPVPRAQVVIDERRAVATSERGAFSLPLLPAGSHRLTVKAEGFLDSQGVIGVMVPGHGSTVPDVVLKRWQPLEVLVTGERGEPVAGAWVIGKGDWEGAAPEVKAISDASGRAVCRVAERGSFTGVVGARGHATTRPLRFTSPRSVVLEREFTTRVTARDASGRRLPLRALAIETRKEGAADFTRAAPVVPCAGRQEAQAVLPREGVFRVRVWSDAGEGVSGEMTAAQLGDGGEIAVTVAAVIAPRVTVVDAESGRPIAGARASIARPLEKPLARAQGSARWVESYTRLYLGVTDAEGGLAIGGEPWERRPADRLAVEAAGYAQEIVSLSGYRAPEVRVARGQGGGIKCLVIDQQAGAGVAGVRVVAHHAHDESFAAATTGAGGAFRLEGLRPGRYVVGACSGTLETAPAGAAGARTSPGREVEVEAGRTADVRLLCSERPRAVLSIEVRENGACAADYTALLEPHCAESADLAPFHGQSDFSEEGCAVFSCVPEGRYELFVLRHGAGRVHSRTILLSGGAWEHLVVDVHVAALATGVVRHAATGALLPGVSVEVFARTSAAAEQGEIVWRTTTDADGRFRFDRLPEGTASARCSAPGMGFATSPQIVVAGAGPVIFPDLLLEPR